MGTVLNFLRGYGLIKVGTMAINSTYVSEGGTFIRDRYDFLVFVFRTNCHLGVIVLIVKPNISELKVQIG